MTTTHSVHGDGLYLRFTHYAERLVTVESGLAKIKAFVRRQWHHSVQLLKAALQVANPAGQQGRQSMQGSLFVDTINMTARSYPELVGTRSEILSRDRNCGGQTACVER